jgi:DNA-binding GntR family transcriptional regulator
VDEEGLSPAEVREGTPAPGEMDGSDRLGALRAIVTEIEAAVKAADAMAYLQADARFHQTIVDLADNRRLSELFRTLVEQGRSFMLGRTPEAMARCRDGPDEHAELLDCVQRGDRRGACRLLAAHLKIPRAEICPDIQNGEE